MTLLTTVEPTEKKIDTYSIECAFISAKGNKKYDVEGIPSVAIEELLEERSEEIKQEYNGYYIKNEPLFKLIELPIGDRISLTAYPKNN